MAFGGRIKLRLFIEGVEVPCIAAQVQATANTPMVAAIQVPPLGEGLKLPPRCIVHLFFYDFNESTAIDLVRKTGSSIPKLSGPTSYDRAIQGEEEANAELHYYKLLFAGELMGVGWTKNPTQRSLVLQCADFSNYWDYAYQFDNTDLFGPGYKALFSGGSTNLFTDFLSEPSSAVLRVIKTPPTRYPNMKPLGGGLIHLVEAIGGSYWYDKKYAGQNIFFSLAELRLRVAQMLTAYEKDQTSSKLLGGSYDGLFGRSLGNLGKQASLRKCITALSSVIFHEMYPQPCPYYKPGTGGSLDGFVRKQLKDIRDFDAVLLEIKSLSNVLDYSGSELAAANTADREELLEVAKNVLVFLVGAQKTCRSILRKTHTLQARRGKKAGAAAGSVGSVVREAESVVRKAVAALRTFTRNRNSKKSIGTEFSEQILALVGKLRELAEFESVEPSSGMQVPAILGQHIFRPDVWFSAPPRCNVLFPEQYVTLQVTRMFMNEPTRLMLKTNDEFFGEDELFDHFYFAPKAITLKGESNQLQAILRNDILDHELYTGILPVFEKMGEFNIFAARSGMVDGKVPKLGLAQRSCNFLFFKHRFSSRQLSVHGRFNPFIAVGMPGLVIDQYVDIESIKAYNQLVQSLPEQYRGATREFDTLLGTHFLASFSQVTHNIEASGQGTTSIGCAYARQPDESVEFLGVRQDEVTGSKYKNNTVRRTTDVASILPPKVNGTGPAWGRIIKVVDVTGRYQAVDVNFGPRLPVYAGTGGLDVGSSGKKKKQTETVDVILGLPQRAAEYGQQIADLVGDPDIVVAFKAYEVTEEIKKGHQEKKIDLPPEEYIRPGWYGDCWHPAKISEVYYDMLNTGAITEPQQIQSADSFGERLTSSDAASAIADAIADDNYQNISSDTSVTLALAGGASIEAAVAHVAYTYSLMKQGGFDVDTFINTYGWRPVATMLDMFGSRDLLFSADGSRAVQGVEGFHSRAFGPYEDLFGLVTPEIEQIVGINRGSPQAQKSDKRKEKLDAVLLYTARLRLSRGILG